MSKGKLTAILLTLTVLVSGGVTMANAHPKPPWFGAPSGLEFGQPPPPPRPGGMPAVPGQVPPPPLPPGMAPPPPGRSTGVQQEILGNASIAISTARNAKAYFAVGKVWSVTAPRGEIELKAAVLYNGTAIAVLHFNPSNGSLLPRGIHPRVFGMTQAIHEVQRNLPEILGKLEVLPGAEYREPESSWIIPLAYNGMIVAHIKIHADGSNIVPDYRANQEMQAYGS